MTIYQWVNILTNNTPLHNVLFNSCKEFIRLLVFPNEDTRRKESSTLQSGEQDWGLRGTQFFLMLGCYSTERAGQNHEGNRMWIWTKAAN